MIYFVMSTLLVFYAFGIIWRSTEWYNLLVKLVFIGFAIWGTILTIQYWTQL